MRPHELSFNSCCLDDDSFFMFVPQGTELARSLWSEHFSLSKKEAMPGEAERKRQRWGDFSPERCFFFFFQNCLYSCTRGPSLLVNERVPAIHALLDGGRLALCRDHDGVLVHQLTAGVGEGGHGQVDLLHLALVHPLFVLLLYVPAPGRDRSRE